MSSDQLSSDQLNSSSLDSNSMNQNLNSSESEQDQNQFNKQIEHNIDEAQSTEELDQTNQINILLNETDTIDLSTSSKKLDDLLHRKRKTEEERALKKKFDSIKIPAQVLSIDETLKNAQKTLYENLKIAKIEHVIVQHLINQIERARVNLDLTDDASITIDQIQTEKNLEFASIDLNKSKTTSTSYSETMSENFQQLEKTIEQKITKLITERFENKSNQARSELETSKKSDSISNHTKTSSSKETSQASRKILTAKKSQTSSKSQTNNQTSSSSSFIWAKVVSKNTTKIVKAQTAKLNETIQWKSRRMIMFSKNFVNAINSTECRNRMNKRLKDEKIDILITMINLSRTRNSIVFIVSKKNIANQLIQCRSVWENEFSIKSVQKDEVWFERIVHDVKIASYDNSMSELQKQIETYNDLTLARESIWLTRLKKRENKTHSSVKISLKLKNDAEKAIKKDLIVKEKVLQITKFLNNRINQCHKCQIFEHLINTCKETNAKCRLCAKNHDTQMHMCLICKSTKSCSHISSKCANCDEAHAANSSNCEHVRAIEIKSRKNNHFVTLWVIQSLRK